METSAASRNLPSDWLNTSVLSIIQTNDEALFVQRLLFIYRQADNDSQRNANRTNFISIFNYLKKGSSQIKTVDEFSHPKNV